MDRGFFRFVTIHAFDRRTDRRLFRGYTVRCIICSRTVKIWNRIPLRINRCLLLLEIILFTLTHPVGYLHGVLLHVAWMYVWWMCTRIACKENLNAAVLKNCHSHDHCLLSKWKRRSLRVRTLICATRQKPCNSVERMGNWACSGVGLWRLHLWFVLHAVILQFSARQFLPFNDFSYCERLRINWTVSHRPNELTCDRVSVDS